MPKLASMSHIKKTRISSVRKPIKPTPISTMPDTIEQGVKHGLGITKQRF